MANTILHYRSPHSTIIKILVFVCVLLIVGLAYYFHTSTHLSQIAENQLLAIHDNELQKAYSYTSNEFQEQTSIKSFRDYVQTYPVLHDNLEFKTEESLIEGNFGYLRATLTAQDKTKMTVEYQFVKDKQSWKIQAIRLSPIDD